MTLTTDARTTQPSHRRSVIGPTQTPKLLLTPEEAAAILSIGRTRVYELMGSGDLTSVRIGISRRIPRAAVESFVSRLLLDARVHTDAVDDLMERPLP